MKKEKNYTKFIKSTIESIHKSIYKTDMTTRVGPYKQIRIKKNRLISIEKMNNYKKAF